MKIYHGTSKENAKNILKNGFSTDKHNWYPSFNDVVYFYFTKEGMDDLETKRKAMENGRIAAALGKSNSPDIYVLSIEIDDCFSDEEYRDYSCEGMSEDALEIPISIIKEKVIEVDVFKNTFVPSLSLIYLSGLSKNPYLNQSQLTDLELQILSNQTYCNELGDIYCCVCDY